MVFWPRKIFYVVKNKRSQLVFMFYFKQKLKITYREHFSLIYSFVVVKFTWESDLSCWFWEKIASHKIINFFWSSVHVCMFIFFTLLNDISYFRLELISHVWSLDMKHIFIKLALECCLFYNMVFLNLHVSFSVIL